MNLYKKKKICQLNQCEEYCQFILIINIALIERKICDFYCELLDESRRVIYFFFNINNYNKLVK